MNSTMLSSHFTGFAHHSADDSQLRYQRNAGIVPNVNILEIGQQVWYQPLTQLAQPLMPPLAQMPHPLSHQLNGFGTPNVPLPAHMAPMLPDLQYNVSSIPSTIAPVPEQNFSTLQNNSSQNEITKVVSINEDNSVHGNWTMKNARFRLFCFCEVNGYPPAYTHLDDKQASKITTHSRQHHCRKLLNLNQLYNITRDNWRCRRPTPLVHLNKVIEGDGKGQTRKEASEKCALSLIQQLHQLQLIETHIAPVRLKKKKELQLEIYKVAVSDKVEKQLNNLFRMMDIRPHLLTPLELHKNTVLKSQKLLLSELEDITAFAQFVLPQWSLPSEKWDPWLNCKITEGTLAEMSMNQIGDDLRNARFQQVENESATQQMLTERLKLPIFSSIGKIMDAIQNNPVMIVHGPNGCGKSTQVPQYILDTYINAGRGGECSIIVIHPRRIGAINIAERIAYERGESVGASCGYSIRFDSWLPRPYGSILFCTPDVLLKKLKSGLRGISHVIVDEIHERDINIDLILLVLREMVGIFYKLRVILLSGPTEVRLFSEYFSNCPIVEVPVGQQFPLADYYLEDCIEMLKFAPPVKTNSTLKSLSKEDDDDDDNAENMNKVIGKNYLKSTAETMAKMSEEEISFELIEAILTYINFLNVPGSVLIFLPGWNVVCEFTIRLRQHLTFGSESYLILPLHSQISRQEVQRVFETAPPGIRKIILSSGVGETGITINDVVYVIDSCKIKLKRFNSHELFFNSAIIWASKRNLDQRRTRAGRTQPGTCFRLCSRARFEKLKEKMPVPMSYTPLDELALTIKFLHLGNVYNFLSQVLQPPPLYLILQAETLLRAIGAIDTNGGLTSLGYVLGQLPVRPQIGKMIVLSCLFELGDPFCTIAPRSGVFMELLDNTSFQQLNHARRHFQGNHRSDFITLVNAFTQWEKAQSLGSHAGSYFCEEFCFSKSAMEITKNAKKQLKGIVQAVGFPGKCISEQDYTSDNSNTDMISALLLVGYHPNVCYLNMRTKKVIVNGCAVDVDSSSLNNFSVDSMPLSESAFFVFEERIHTRPYCKELTMITPIQLLLFGHGRVEIIDKIIVVDGWIRLKMDLQLASNLLSLRKHLDTILLEIIAKPSLFNRGDICHFLSVIKDLCSRNAIVQTFSVKPA